MVDMFKALKIFAFSKLFLWKKSYWKGGALDVLHASEWLLVRRPGFEVDSALFHVVSFM